ncbi:MAG: serine/threonine protein kinase, partial [Deltaproteobacteria bacterium]|nr:serine/threonine protein kinase [Deltaproteobacteria bacterium]
MSGVGVGHGEIAVGQLLEGTAYRLLEVLGRGASAVVYRAEHTKLRTRVVIKWMNATMSADPDRAGRMRLEAQALARLAHPNLVAVTDSGVAGDRLFFVMEDDGGVALEAAIGASGRLSPEDAVRAVGDVLEGLAFIHESGLVHRDLHPDNLLVSTRADGSRVVRILDLGLVKVLSGHEQHRLGPLALPTAEGTTLGTPRYMAPEQVRGGPVDARSDLYAIGCVLHRLLVGRDPYAHHATAGQVLAAQLAEPVRPPSTWLPDFGLGPALERELMRALEKEPARRFASAHEMSAALRAAVVADGPARQSLPAPDSSEHPGLGGTIAITDVTP